MQLALPSTEVPTAPTTPVMNTGRTQAEEQPAQPLELAPVPKKEPAQRRPSRFEVVPASEDVLAAPLKVEDKPKQILTIPPPEHPLTPVSMTSDSEDVIYFVCLEKVT